VVDAKAMGIVNSKDRVQPSGRRNARGEDQNYMVKVTETYNPNTQITEDQTIQVTFTRVTNTQTTELQTGTSTHVATADPITIERVTDMPGNIVLTNVIGYEFRLLSDESVVQDWLSSDLETIEFIFDEALTDLVIESRSLNASISFTTFEDFTYTIKQGEQVIYEDLLDNDSVDGNESVGAMTISGLTEGLAYDVTYVGYQVIETITQDEVDGQVDKLFVLYQYTFISFVPLNLNPRPQDQDLELDYDDIPLYDKTGFYSDSTRQSFVVDNNTGLIYKIEGVNIASLSGGCVAIQDNPFPFDMRITQLGELQFYSLHINNQINSYTCNKDKFGNKFVQNNRLNLYDETTNTTYYVNSVNSFYDALPYLGNSSFWLTSSGEIIEIVEDIGVSSLPLSASIFTDNSNKRELTENDNFKIIPNSNYWPGFTLFKPFMVKDGIVYTSDGVDSSIYSDSFYQRVFLGVFNPKSKIYTRMMLDSSPYQTNSWNLFFLEKYNILLELIGGKLSYYSNIWFYFNAAFPNDIPDENGFNGKNYDYWTKSLFENNSVFQRTIILENVALNENGKVTETTLNGSVTYDIVLQRIDGEFALISYVSGTYIVPPSTTITLQPINR
jgi:hypothetical protein